MGQKIHPFLYRVISNKNWNSSWCTNKINFSNFLIEDIEIRNYLFNFFKNFLVWKIFIQKSHLFVFCTIFIKKKKTVIKKMNLNIEDLSDLLSDFVGRDCYVFLKNITKINSNPFIIFCKIKKKILQKKSFKNTLKNIFMNYNKEGALGLKIIIKGRINNSTMAKKQVFRNGKMPLQSISSNISFYKNFVKTSYGTIGIKVWVYKGGKIF